MKPVPRAGAHRLYPLYLGGILLCALLGAAASSASAQRRVDGEIAVHLGAAAPVGAFADHVEGLGGVGFSVTNFLDMPGLLGLRFDLTGLAYGHNKFRVPLAPPLDVEVTTENTALMLTLGPILELTNRRLRPYVHTALGLSRFATETTISGSTYDAPTDLADWTWALGVGGGLRFGGGVDPVFPEFAPMLELGMSYVHHGSVQYLTEDRARAAVLGAAPVDPVRSNAAFVLIYLRFILGLRGA